MPLANTTSPAFGQRATAAGPDSLGASAIGLRAQQSQLNDRFRSEGDVASNAYVSRA